MIRKVMKKVLSRGKTTKQLIPISKNNKGLFNLINEYISHTHKRLWLVIIYVYLNPFKVSY